MENQLRMEELLKELLSKFERPISQTDLLTTRIGHFGSRIDGLAKKLDAVILKLDILTARVDELAARVEEWKE